MTRFTFGGGAADFTFAEHMVGGQDYVTLAPATITFWSAQTGGTNYTDLVLNGVSVSSITASSSGGIPSFQGPDGVSSMWADGGAGRVRMYAYDAYADTTDAAVATAVEDPASATRTALSATYAVHGEAFDPNDVGYDVILIIGQSNAVGGGTDTINTTYLDPPTERIKQYPGSGTFLGQIVAGIDGLYHLYQSSTVGPGMPFAREYLRHIKANRSVLLVPAAEGSTGFNPSSTGFDGIMATWDPNDTTTAKNLYNLAVAQCDAAIAAGGSKSRLAGVIWVQGENDAGVLNQSQYATKLDSLIDALRTHYANPTLPFVIGQMTPGNIASNPSSYGLINAAHIDTPRRKVNTGFAYGAAGAANFLSSAPIHYSAAGNRLNGYQLADQMVRFAPANVLGVAPVPPTAVILAQSTTTLAVTWTRTPGHVTDYNVQYRSNGGAWTNLTRSQSLDTTATITGLTLGATIDVQLRTVNDVGNSAWTSSATIVLLNPPAQVTGLSAGTATATTVPLSWTAPSGSPTSYKVEASTNGGTTWTTAATVTTTSTTVGSLVPATSYLFRVTAINAGGSGTPSSTVSVTTATLPILLTAVPVAAYRAYSVRQLSTSYAGSAVRVRRSSDNTEQDVGFVGNVLDTASLLSFVGSGSGFVTKWYDQSGNGRDIAQTTVGSQPRIVNAGTIDTVNGIPAVRFDGVDDLLDASTSLGLYSAGAMSAAMVVSATSGAVNTIVSEVNNGVDNGATYKILGSPGAGTQHFQIRNDAPSNVTAPNATGTAWDGTAHQFLIVDSGSNISGTRDNTSVLSQAYTRSGTLATVNRFSVGAREDQIPEYSAALVSELVFWASALSGTNQTAANSNQKGYFGTP